jgi:5-(carboxyamino)imidazole ribonucleotide mutase
MLAGANGRTRANGRAAAEKGKHMAEATPLVGIIMGSESDMPAMEPCMKQLEEFGIPYEVKVASAHRKPAEVHDWASSAVERGLRVIVAAAGKAAHLGGVVAAYTPLPVITVPMKTSDLGGLDSLLSMVQMPSGVPVACVAINGAKNAAILAVQILGTGRDDCRQKIADFKAKMAE